MVHFIDKDALLAVIERLRNEDGNPYFPSETADKYYARGVHFTCDRLVNFLDILEVKEVQEEHVSEELEKAAEEDFMCRCENHIFGMDFHKPDMISAFKAGAKWQKKNIMEDATNVK